jgi:hypothetical protein
MNHTMRTIVVIGGFLGLLLLSACGTATPAGTPTVDLNAFRTEVAATVLAQVSQAAALTPSATLIPTFTATSAATNTLAATQTPLLSSTPGTPGTQAAVTSGTPGAVVTATVVTNNRAAWVSQTIADGTRFEPGETFTMTWTIRNVGESTWTAGYLIRFFAGDAFGAQREYPLNREVAPQQTIEISIPMKAPTRPGDYRTDWVLSDAFRSNFKEPVFLKITVAGTPTPDATATRTPVPTNTPGS